MRTSSKRQQEAGRDERTEHPACPWTGVDDSLGSGQRAARKKNARLRLLFCTNWSSVRLIPSSPPPLLLGNLRPKDSSPSVGWDPLEHHPSGVVVVVWSLERLSLLASLVISLPSSSSQQQQQQFLPPARSSCRAETDAGAAPSAGAGRLAREFLGFPSLGLSAGS